MILANPSAEIDASRRDERFRDIANRIADIVAREVTNADEISPRDASNAVLVITREFQNILPERMLIKIAETAVERERERRREIAEFRASQQKKRSAS